MAVWRKYLDEATDESPDSQRAIQRFKVVQHEDQRLLQFEDSVGQSLGDTNRVARRPPGEGIHCNLSALPKPGEPFVDGSDEILRKETQVPLTFVGGIPAHGDLRTLREIDEDRRLAIARRGRDER
jgi:hypothetical protein